MARTTRSIDPQLAAELGSIDIARQVSAARRSRGLTERDLATKIQTTESAISRLETGRQGASAATLARIATVTAVTLRIRPAAEIAADARLAEAFAGGRRVGLARRLEAARAALGRDTASATRPGDERVEP